MCRHRMAKFQFEECTLYEVGFCCINRCTIQCGLNNNWAHQILMCICHQLLVSRFKDCTLNEVGVLLHIEVLNSITLIPNLTPSLGICDILWIW